MNIFQRAINAGYSCYPCNGKIPTVPWKKYMSEFPTMKEAENWSGNIGIVCGNISGGLTCIDFDIKNGDRWDVWLFDVNNIIPSTLSRLYIENTPSGGYHVVFRSDYECRSKKLASNKDGTCMIETRGEKGCFISAPSEGYKLYYGKLAGLKKISHEEAEILIATGEVFDEREKKEYKPSKAAPIIGDSVFNRYDSTMDPCDILLSHGWTIAFKNGETVYLRRPEKKEGISATWNAVPGRFYCFTTSTEFENEHAYKPSAVYTVLEHGGNIKAACKQLASEGFSTGEKNG